MDSVESNDSSELVDLAPELPRFTLVRDVVFSRVEPFTIDIMQTTTKIFIIPLACSPAILFSTSVFFGVLPTT